MQALENAGRRSWVKTYPLWNMAGRSLRPIEKVCKLCSQVFQLLIVTCSIHRHDVGACQLDGCNVLKGLNCRCEFPSVRQLATVILMCPMKRGTGNLR